MTKSKTGYVVLDREDFVTERYKRFKKNREFWDQIDPNRETMTFTDLDRDYGDGLMKDIVLCDTCNENITDSQFLLFENSYCYHFDCAEKRHGYKREQHVQVEKYENIINMMQWREEHENYNDQSSNPPDSLS